MPANPTTFQAIDALLADQESEIWSLSREQTAQLRAFTERSPMNDSPPVAVARVECPGCGHPVEVSMELFRSQQDKDRRDAQRDHRARMQANFDARHQVAG